MPDPVADVVRAWTDRLGTPEQHLSAVDDVRDAMLDLAAALDRLSELHPEHRGQFWHPAEG
jgi:hypothetical protein